VKLHDLFPAPGSKKAAVRVARGRGGKRHKTAGRGTKGQTKRNTVAMQFEGGQIPLIQRTPKKRGFNNPFRIEYLPLNIDTINEFEGDEITPDTLRAKGIIPKKGFVKVLGRGELNRKVSVSAHAFSESAKAAITAAGGTVTVIPLPFGDRRPPAKGNQFANR